MPLHMVFELIFSFLLMLNSQGSGLDVPDADLETDEDLVTCVTPLYRLYKGDIHSLLCISVYTCTLTSYT